MHKTCERNNFIRFRHLLAASKGRDVPVEIYRGGGGGGGAMLILEEILYPPTLKKTPLFNNKKKLSPLSGQFFLSPCYMVTYFS